MPIQIIKSGTSQTAFNRSTIIFVAALAFILSRSTALADIATWGPTGWSGTAASPLAAGSKDANLTSASLARSGLTGGSSSSRYSSSGWNTTANYLTVTLTPASTYTLNLDGASLIGAWGSSSTGPGSFQVFSSVDGYTTSLGTFTSTTSGQTANQTITLPSSGFNFLSSITFRFVGSATTVSGGATGASGTGGPSYIDITGAVVPPAPPAPTANAATTVTSSSFSANWSSAATATGYYLDVATDSGFTSILSSYNGVDVGNVLTVPVTGLSASTAYYYRVRAYNAGGTSGNSSTINVTTLSASAPAMTVKLPGESSANAGGATAQTAGTAFSVTLTATTDGTTVNTGYSGTKTITFSGPSGSPSYPSTVSFSSGVGTAGITLVKAETTTITATDGSITGVASSSLTVNPGAINSYVVTATSPQQTNTAFAVTVTAKDSSGNTVATDNSTTVTMTSNSGNIQFDGNNNGTFGESGDNVQTLASGTFTINAIDVATAPETVHITATDGNSKTGTSGSIVINLIPKFKSLASGNWSDYTTWQVSYDGGATFAAAAAGVTPSSASDTIEIQGGHLVTNTAALTIDQVSVDAGGKLFNNAALTLANGDGTDLDVFGTLINSATITINSSATIVFESGGKYQHNYTSSAGAIPTATWNAGSTCEVIGYTSNTSAPNGLGQSFWNFTWNCPNQTGNISMGGALTTINGDLTVTSSSTKEFRFGAGTSPTINIGGNWIIQGGTNVTSTGAGSPIINLTGNLIISSGGLNLGSSTGTTTVNLSGNVSLTGGTLSLGTGTGNINLVAAGTQNFTNTGTAFSGAINWAVNDGSTLNIVSGTVGGSGTFTVSGNGIVTGTGTIKGTATINGALAPGSASSIGALTFASAPTLNGTSDLKINRNGGAPLADQIIVTSGTLNYGGTLNVANIGAGIQAGDSFTNFVASSYNGSFTSTTLPPLAGSLAWDTTQLTVSGSIDVPSSTVSSIPLGFNVSGGNFTFTWTDASFDLQSSTNVAGPYVTISGATTGFSTNAASAPRMFFRLHHP